MSLHLDARYRSPLIALHWVMLLLIIAAYACIELRELFPKGSDPREALKRWHFMLGLSIGGLVWIRLFLRLTRTPPPIVPPPGRLLVMVSGAAHWALYALMLGMPIAGWLILSGEGKPIPYFGLELPPLIAKDKALAKQIQELHATVGQAGYFLIGAHALAAVYHHYVRRDNTLQRMLPAGLGR
jgi:superoxide oxidase